MQLDALGMDAEPVARLESLFRMELQRLAGRPLPSRSRVARVIRSSRRLRRCAGQNRCLAAIGKKLGVDVVVSGSVAALGDSYVVNIKAIDVKTRAQLQRIATPPLRGSPDELIYEVRVAAYRLLAPQHLRGGVMVLSDLVGASVSVDGKRVGITPLRLPVRGLDVGKHRLVVAKNDYTSFDEKIDVRFQKITRVVVHLVESNRLPPSAALTNPRPPRTIYKKRPAKKRWYHKKLVWIGAGVTAVLLGGYVGYKLAHDPITNCTDDPSACLGM